MTMWRWLDWVVAAVLPLGCAASRGPAPRAPTVATAAERPPVVTSQPEEPTPPRIMDEAAKRFPKMRVLLAEKWPGARGFDDTVLALVEQSENMQPAAYWFRTSEEGVPKQDVSYLTESPRRIVLADVDGDGRTEALVFVTWGGSTEENLADVLELAPGEEIGEMPRAQYALWDVRSREELLPLLPLSRGLPAEDLATAPILGVVGRLTYGTRDQFLVLVERNGFEICQTLEKGPKLSKPKCRKVKRSAIDTATFEKEVQAPIAYNLDAEHPMFDSCDGTPCRVDIHSDPEMQLEFVGEAAARRLVRITYTREEEAPFD